MKLDFPVFSNSVTYSLGRNKDLDFYYRRGQAIVATKGIKNRKGRKKISPEQRKTHLAFRQARDWFYHLGENTITAYKNMAASSDKTWKDIFYSQYLQNLFKTAWAASQVLEFRFYGEENNLQLTFWTDKKGEFGLAEILNYRPVREIRIYRGKAEICDRFPTHLPYVHAFELATEINIGAQKTNIKPSATYQRRVTWDRIPLDPLNYASSYYASKHSAGAFWYSNREWTPTEDPFASHFERITTDYLYWINVSDPLCYFVIDVPLDLIPKIKSFHISKGKDYYETHNLDAQGRRFYQQYTDIVVGGNVIYSHPEAHDYRLPRRPFAQKVPLNIKVYIIPPCYRKFYGAFGGVPALGTSASWKWRPATYSVDLKFHRYVRKKAGITRQQINKLMAIVQRIPGMEGYLMISPLFRPEWYRASWKPLSMLEDDDFDPVKTWPSVPWPEFPKTPEQAAQAADSMDSDERVEYEDPEFWLYENY